MPRKNRQDTVSSESVHHIFQKGLNGCPIFREERDYEYYRMLMLRYKDKHRITIYNYCLMPDHINMLIYVGRSADLSKFIQALSLSYSAFYRRSYGHSGYLWQGRYKNIAISSHGLLLECARYIERNPMRTGPKVQADPSEHRWSSYNFYANGAEDSIITQNPLFDTLGDNIAERKARYREYISMSRPYDEILDKAFNIENYLTGRI